MPHPVQSEEGAADTDRVVREREAYRAMKGLARQQPVVAQPHAQPRDRLDYTRFDAVGEEEEEEDRQRAKEHRRVQAGVERSQVKGTVRDRGRTVTYFRDNNSYTTVPYTQDAAYATGRPSASGIPATPDRKMRGPPSQAPCGWEYK